MLTIILLHPTPDGKFSVGLQVDYELNISTGFAAMLFQMSYLPPKSRDSADVTIAANVDASSQLPAPPLDSVLTTLFAKNWPNITSTSIPMFDSMKGFAFSGLSVGIGPGPKTNGFSISAQVTEFSILADPSLILQNAHMTLGYQGSWQNGQLDAELVFAKKYIFHALFALPTDSKSAKLEFENINDKFTLNELVTLIKLGGLTKVPIIDYKILGAICVDHVFIEFHYDKGKLSIASLGARVAWTASLGFVSMLPTSSLLVGWQQDPLASIPSVAGAAGDLVTDNHWTIQWEGPMTRNWHLTADIRLSNIKSQGTFGIVSGRLLNSSGDITAGDLTNALTPDNGKPSTLWNMTVPQNIKQVITLTGCVVNVAVGNVAIFGVVAEVPRGFKGSSTAALVVRPVAPPGFFSSTSVSWSFALAVSIKDFTFTDLLLDSDLSKKVDGALVRHCQSNKL